MNTGFPSRPNGWLSSENSKAEGLRPADSEEGRPNDFAAALALLAGMMTVNPTNTPVNGAVPVPVSPSGETIPGARPTVEATASLPIIAKTPAKVAAPESNPNETPTLELPAWMEPVEFGEAATPEPEVAYKARATKEPAPLMEMTPILQDMVKDAEAPPKAIVVGSDISSAIVAALAEHNPTHSRDVSLPATAAAPAQVPSPEAATLRPVEAINDIRRAHFGKDTADIVVGDGDSRVDLSIAAQGQHVRVSATVATPEVALHLREHAQELGTALAKHGLNLDTLSFDFETGGNGGEPRQPETLPEHDDDSSIQPTPETTRDLRAIA
ncbi:MAG: hypothetical protein SGI86_00385 [Deltaproteobacteria bacterium]|nr:hypothetical protein [Deltaproteobacteria bacterium]